MKSFSSVKGGRSIRTHLVLFTIFLVFSIICILTSLTTWNSIRLLKERSHGELSRTLKQSADELADFIELRQANLDLWAAQPIFEVLFSSPELAELSAPGVRNFFSGIRTNKPWLVSILLTDQGKILYDDSHMFTGLGNWSGAANLKQLLKDPDQTSFVFELPAVSQTVQTLFFIKRPFVENKQPVPGKYLVALVNLEELQRSLFADARVGEHGFVVLSAQRKAKPAWISGVHGGTTEALDFSELTRHRLEVADIPSSYGSLILEVRRLGEYPLALVGAASRRDILKTAYALVRVPVIAGILVLLGGIGGTVLLSKKIARPLVELLDDVNQIHFDKLEQFKRSSKESPYTEVRILHKAFAAMVQNLIVSRKELHRKHEELLELDQSLRMQRNFLHTTLSSIGEGVITTDTEANITFMNSVAEQILECGNEAAIGKPLSSVFRIIAEETRAEIENPVEKVITSGKIVGVADHLLLISKNGRELSIDSSGAPIRNEEGQLYGVVLVFRDVGERRIYEKQVLANQEHFRILFENNPVSIWLEDFSGIRKLFDELRESGVSDLESYLQAHPETVDHCVELVRIIDVNRATLTLHEAETKEELFAKLRGTITPESHKAFQEELVDLWRGKTRITQDSIIKTLAGKPRYVTLSCTVVSGYEESFGQVLVSITDVTERQRLEEQLFQAQKMETVGTLAGGIAHDFNNMLSVIIGYSELALKKGGDEHSLRDELQEILAAARRSAEITRQLLGFARKQTISPQVLSLNDTVEGMLKMLRRLLGENIDLAWCPKKDIWPVYMDPNQIDQILVNLCVNARDAISDVGKITIETGMKTFDRAYCLEHAGFSPGDFVMLAVSDDGIGMDKRTMERIFDPFFTTKKVGQGTGLGLATIYGIVKQNEGFINVYSEPGKGTTFRIYFAGYAGELIQQFKHVQEGIPDGQGELVLVVEDEASTRKIIERMLRDLGYRVLTAKSPSEAMQLARVKGPDISLLLTDVILPEMNGRELAINIQNLRPGLTCLFMSGYTANVIAHRAILDKGIHFIQKPFAQADLAHKIREALDTGRVTSHEGSNFQKKGELA